MKTWVLELPLRDIYDAVFMKEISPKLVAALVSVESSGNTKATRYESHYRYILDADQHAKLNGISMDTEIFQQKTSWGLMQIMGGVAREHGFNGPLVDLCDPKTGLYYGVMHLNKFMQKYDTLEEALSSYNQGGPYTKWDGTFKNQKYVDKIIDRYKYLEDTDVWMSKGI